MLHVSVLKVAWTKKLSVLVFLTFSFINFSCVCPTFRIFDIYLESESRLEHLESRNYASLMSKGSWPKNDQKKLQKSKMKIDYKFSNLCGTVYKTGNLLFTSDGNSLISPVGNRISIFNLVTSKSTTLPIENNKDIQRISLSPIMPLLISVDVDGRALLINYEKRVILHRHNFKQPIKDIKFSPNGKFIAVTFGNMVQVWLCPGINIEFQPFVLYKTYSGHHDLVTSIEWSECSEFILSCSKDMTCRLFPLEKQADFAGICLSGHNDVVVGGWFSNNFIYTVSRDGALYEWKKQGDNWSSNLENNPEIPRKKNRNSDKKQQPIIRYKSTNKYYFEQNHARVVSCSFHQKSGILAVGFDSGIFGLWEMPDFVNIQTLRYFY